jgi:hypothetical protein
MEKTTGDILCENYKRAKVNRKMVQLKQNIEAYLYIEQMVRNWPRSKPLPEGLIGRVATLGKHENMFGLHEVNG